MAQRSPGDQRTRGCELVEKLMRSTSQAIIERACLRRTVEALTRAAEELDAEGLNEWVDGMWHFGNPDHEEEGALCVTLEDAREILGVLRSGAQWELRKLEAGPHGPEEED